MLLYIQPSFNAFIMKNMLTVELNAIRSFFQFLSTNSTTKNKKLFTLYVHLELNCNIF